MHELIYVGDAMCSWCWGFSPVLDAIRARFGSQFQFRLVLGGLRPGPAAEKLDARLKKLLKTEWAKVAKATGQPVDERFFERDDFIYDTHPAACAIAAMRILRPGSELDFLKVVQQAFFAGNVDVTTSASYADLVRPFGVDPAQFVAMMRSDQAAQAAIQDYKTAHQTGVRGFPCLLIQHGGNTAYIAKGYLPFNAVEPLLIKIAGKAAK